MSEVKLGQLAKAEFNRDAVHVAVIPMKASIDLRPGERVGIVSDGVAGPSKVPIGIVDPFLNNVVGKGERFWLCLFPSSVTGMRHHWEHPAFMEVVEDKTSVSKLEAKNWLIMQCDSLGCDLEDLVSEQSDLVKGEYILTNTNESARDHWYLIEETFWKMHEIYTGKHTPRENRGGFTCSC